MSRPTSLSPALNPTHFLIPALPSRPTCALPAAFDVPTGTAAAAAAAALPSSTSGDVVWHVQYSSHMCTHQLSSLRW